MTTPKKAAPPSADSPRGFRRALSSLFVQEVGLALPRALELHIGAFTPLEWEEEVDPYFQRDNYKTRKERCTRIFFPNGPKTETSVLAGRFRLFDDDEWIAYFPKDAIGTVLHGECDKEARLTDFLKDVERFALEMSPFRRAALSVSYSKGFFGLPATSFDFLDVSTAYRPVFNGDIEHRIDTFILSLLRDPSLGDTLGLQPRRTVLLHGTYGTGKTLLTKYLANEAVKAGWTFLYCTTAESYSLAYSTARQLLNGSVGVVLFIEDSDTDMDGERNAKNNAMLNMMDGIGTKDDRILTIFSTNRPEDIGPAFLRPGRLDLKLKLEPADAETALRICALYQYPATAEAGPHLNGLTPAILREVITRAKLVHKLEGRPLTDQLLLSELTLLQAEDAGIPPQIDKEENAGDAFIRRIAREVVQRM